MSVCLMPNSQGFLAVVADMATTACTGGYVAVTPEEYSYIMSYTQVTSSEATVAFTGGFIAVFAAFASTYAIKMALKVIKLL